MYVYIEAQVFEMFLKNPWTDTLHYVCMYMHAFIVLHVLLIGLILGFVPD